MNGFKRIKNHIIYQKENRKITKITYKTFFDLLTTYSCTRVSFRTGISAKKFVYCCNSSGDDEDRSVEGEKIKIFKNIIIWEYKS